MVVSEDVFVGVGGIRSFEREDVALIRVLSGEQGLFLSTDPGPDVTGVMEAVETKLD